MVPSSACGGAAWGSAGEAADQAKAIGQGGGAGRLPLQQLQAGLHHLGLAEAKGLAEGFQLGLTAVVQAHGDGSHRSQGVLNS